MSRQDSSASLPSREIVTSRLFDEAKAEVFHAWTEPSLLARWWGPKGFSNTFHEFDQRPGGHWRFIMHGPDGVDYQNHSVFREIVSGEKIIFDHISGPQFQVVATFSEESGKTRLTFRMIFPTEEQCNKIRSIVTKCNEENFDRLQEQLVLKAQGLSGYEMTIVRLINAPRQAVFDVWTKNLSQWWGPHGVKTTVCTMDLKTGGGFHTIMHGPDGQEYPTHGVFLEVVEPARIVFSDSFREGWIPAQTPFLTAVITLEEMGGQTRYTARALHKSEEDRSAHESMGFYPGWNQCVDQLAALVEKGLNS